MDVDVEDDEKQNTKQQQRGTKRAWSEDETTNDQKEPIPIDLAALAAPLVLAALVEQAVLRP